MTKQHVALRRMVLVSQLHIRSWTGKKKDSAAVETVKKSHGTENSNIGTFIKNLINLDLLKPIEQAKRELTSYQRDHTFDHGRNQRLVSSKHFTDYEKGIQERMDTFSKAVQEFCDDAYPTAINEQKKRLGTLYDASQYLEPSDMQKMFSVEHNTFPLPDENSADDLIGLSERAVQELKESMAIEQVNQENKMHHAARMKLYEVAQKMSDRLAMYNPEGETKYPFRDSLVENVIEMVDLLPEIYPLDDPEFDELAKEIKENLTNHTAQELREDKEKRQSTQKNAQKFADKAAALGINNG